MYAVISLAGHQFTVKEGDKFEVNSLEVEQGGTFAAEVLALFDDAGKLELGMPTVEGKFASLKVVEHQKGEKVRIFKMKSKKRFRRNRGFRPTETIVEVVSLTGGKMVEKPAKAVIAAAEGEEVAEKPAAKPKKVVAKKVVKAKD